MKTMAVEREEVDQRRDERQQDLEEDHVRQGAPADPAVSRGVAADDGALVLPDRLHRAERPAVALTPEPAEGRGRLGPGSRVLGVDHPVTQAPDGEGEVGVLGEGVARARRRPRGACSRRNAPIAPGTVGVHCSTSYMRRSRLKPMTYSMCCQRPSRPRRLPTFVLPATAPTRGSASGCDEAVDGVALEDGVAVDHDDDLGVRVQDARRQRRGLAAVGRRMRRTPLEPRSPPRSRPWRRWSRRRRR